MQIFKKLSGMTGFVKKSWFNQTICIRFNHREYFHAQKMKYFWGENMNLLDKFSLKAEDKQAFKFVCFVTEISLFKLNLNYDNAWFYV